MGTVVGENGFGKGGTSKQATSAGSVAGEDGFGKVGTTSGEVVEGAAVDEDDFGNQGTTDQALTRGTVVGENNIGNQGTKNREAAEGGFVGETCFGHDGTADPMTLKALRAEVPMGSELVEAHRRHSCEARAKFNNAIRAAARGKGYLEEGGPSSGGSFASGRKADSRA